MKNKYVDLSSQFFSVNQTSLHQLELRAGGTPFYLYSRNVILEKLKELKEHLPPELKIYYAIKANPMISLVDFLSDKVDGFDVSSSGELQIALNSGMSNRCISFAGPGKTDDELSMAIGSNVLIVAESQTEIKRIHLLQKKLGLNPRVALRINPDFEMKNSGMKMGGGAKPFGIDSSLAIQTLRELANLNIRLEGLHFYLGSQNLSASTINTTLTQTVDFVIKLASELPPELTSINLGGGFGIPYFDNDVPLDLSEIRDHFSREINRLKKYYPHTKFSIELGRFIVGESGVFVTKIVDKKISNGSTFLILDGGMNHHLAASGNLGQIIKRNFPVAILNKLAEVKQENVSISGPLCTPLDSFGSNIQMMSGEIGDYLGIFQSGAYGLSASPTSFLSHRKANEILI